MPVYTIPNLATQLVTEAAPWDYEHPGYPEGVDTKEKYRAWCLAPGTEHFFYSLVEGANPTVRVSASNEPRRFHGAVVDYDAAIPVDTVLAILEANCPSNLMPTYWSTTFSGGIRLVWVFQEPVPFCTAVVAERFFTKVSKELRAPKLLPGIDMNVWGNHSQFFEMGQNWQTLGGTIPANLTRAWLMHASNNAKVWHNAGVVVPLDVIREEAESRWPGRWPGGWQQFTINSRGLRFWDDSATNTNAAVVRETGMQYFTDGGGFKKWEDIFGPDFVRHWIQDRLGGAVGEFFFDSSEKYWRKVDGGWFHLSRQDVLLSLRGDFGLASPKPGPKQEAGLSELESALLAIHSTQRVIASAPFLFRPEGPFYFNGSRWLNTSKVRPILPMEGVVQPEWGQGFTWIASYLEQLFEPIEQLPYFMTWLAHFYRGALEQNPQRGLGLFIAGPPNAGKTFLNKALLGQLMGGSQEAETFLQGSDQFNDHLFSAPLWTVDDAVTSGSDHGFRRAAFTQMVKKVIANDSFKYRAMRQSGFTFPWVGRIVATMNDDPESLQILPELDVNILDKIMLLKVKRPQMEFWPSDTQLLAELPYFGAFLRDFEPPAECIGNVRFGVQPYRHPDLVCASNSISTTTSFEEVLEIFRVDWFKDGPGREDTEWVGNPTKLLSDMDRLPSIRNNIAKNFASATRIGVHLNKLMRMENPTVTRAGWRTYRITPKIGYNE